MVVFLLVFLWLYDFSWRVFYHIHPLQASGLASEAVDGGIYENMV